MTMHFLDLLDAEPPPPIHMVGREDPPSILDLPLAPGVTPREYGLRWYQTDARDKIHEALKENRSCLVVMATGLGKTVLFSAIAGDWTEGSILILVHRDELVRQTVATLERLTGEMIEIEQGELRASDRARIVVASVQSIMRQNRLDRMGARRFGLIIVDEAHHYISPSFRKPIDFFEYAKVIGVTATPDRGDEAALGQIFDDVAYVMDIQDGIETGYLVDVTGQRVEVETLDISGVDNSNGDLNSVQLDEAMVKAVEGIVRKSVDLVPARPGIWFWPGVKSAQYAAEKFNVLQPGSTGFVSGMTPPDERRQLIEDFRAGRLLRLSNCMVLTEGFDAPRASVIGMARPTKSRALYAQAIGRGTRPVCESLGNYMSKDEGPIRKKLIRASEKPDCLILDFVGNSGRHSLMGPEDVLGGNYTAVEVEYAKKQKPSGGVLVSLQKAREELRRIAAATQARVQAKVNQFDPFGVLHLNRGADQAEMRFGYKPMTPGQLEALKKIGLRDQDLEGISRTEASKLLGAAFKRMDLGLASYKQLRALKKYGIDDVRISFKRASEAMTYLQQMNWKDPDPRRLHSILYAPRQPGED